MLSIRNVPIVIEPGVPAIEAEFAVTGPPKKRRSFPVQLLRVDLDGDALSKLPFIPATKLPHVFSLTNDPEDSATLVVYDNVGRISRVYVRDEKGKSWERRDVAAEHAGKSVTQFSVRFSFGSEKSRDEFMFAIDRVLAQLQAAETPARRDVESVFKILSRSRVAPVVMPVAIAKADLKQVKI
jgi:hypothetical protein